MFDDCYYFFRESLTTWTRPRRPRSKTNIFDKRFCQQYSNSQNHSDFKILSEYIFQKVLTNIPAQGAVLDISCGPGYLLRELAMERPGVSFFGLDISPEMLNLAKESIEKHKIENIQLKLGNMVNLAEIFGGQKFDFILWNFAAHYCQTDAEFSSVLDGISKLLTPVGTFFMVDLVRFKKEKTRVWFSKKYDLPVGEEFYQEVQDSYLSAYSPKELIDGISQRSFGDFKFEWSPVFPVLFVAHNLKQKGLSQGDDSLTLEQKIKSKILLFLLNIFARPLSLRSLGKAQTNPLD
jgi:ubiquinone/menaquinone biosynthesis C-methylase UbiE